VSLTGIRSPSCLTSAAIFRYAQDTHELINFFLDSTLPPHDDSNLAKAAHGLEENRRAAPGHPLFRISEARAPTPCTATRRGRRVCGLLGTRMRRDSAKICRRTFSSYARSSRFLQMFFVKLNYVYALKKNLNNIVFGDECSNVGR